MLDLAFFLLKVLKNKVQRAYTRKRVNAKKIINIKIKLEIKHKIQYNDQYIMPQNGNFNFHYAWSQESKMAKGSYKAEDIKMQDKSYQQKLAKGMAKGIDSYYGYK